MVKGEALWPGIITTEHFHLEVASYLCPSLISVMRDEGRTAKTSLGNKMVLSTAFNRALLRTWMEKEFSI